MKDVDTYWSIYKVRHVGGVVVADMRRLCIFFGNSTKETPYLAVVAPGVVYFVSFWPVASGVDFFIDRRLCGSKK